MGEVKCHRLHVEQPANGAVPIITQLLCHPFAFCPLDELSLIGIYEKETLGEARIHQSIRAEGLAEQSWLYATDDTHRWIFNQFRFFRLAVDSKADVRPDGKHLGDFRPCTIATFAVTTEGVDERLQLIGHDTHHVTLCKQGVTGLW